MEYLPRPVGSCGFRDQVREEAGTESARCGLVAEILGSEEPALVRVGRDACLACCQAQQPVRQRINPVIASILYPAAEALAARGVDAARMSRIRHIAERMVDSEIPAEEATAPWPRRAVVTCGYRGTAIAAGNASATALEELGPAYVCHHPAHATTTDAACRLCRDWSEVPGPAPPPLAQLVPGPTPRRGAPISRWAVGVTTAPRRQETVSWCLDSLARAGWNAPRLFVDARTQGAERHAHLETTLRVPAVGAWPNYYLGLAELLMREPAADAYLMVQDDAFFYDREDLREHLEAALWPEWPVGAVSLYCPMSYTQPEAGWHTRIDPWVFGALAFVFPREAAKRLIADLNVLEHRWSRRNEGLANIDVVIGRWAQRYGLPVYYPTPSLVQHIGDTSTLWPRARALGVRKADRFAGDSPAVKAHSDVNAPPGIRPS
jgi:hypothetical protein